MLTAKAALQIAGWGLKKGPSGIMVIPAKTQKNKAAHIPLLELYSESTGDSSMAPI